MPVTSLMLTPGTYCCRATAISGELVRLIWLASTALMLEGILVDLETAPVPGEVG